MGVQLPPRAPRVFHESGAPGFTKLPPDVMSGGSFLFQAPTPGLGPAAEPSATPPGAHFDAHVASDGSDKPLPGAIRAGASHLGRNGYFFIIQAPGMPTTHSSSPKGGGDPGGADPDDLLDRAKTRLRRAPDRSIGCGDTVSVPGGGHARS